jgi:hypothetical protein
MEWDTLLNILWHDYVLCSALNNFIRQLMLRIDEALRAVSLSQSGGVTGSKEP